MVGSAAYRQGYMAGLTPKALITQPNGTKVLATPDNPYTGRWQFYSRYKWDEGYRQGQIANHRMWINHRVGVRYVL